jgi:hypothetical protein
MLTFFHWSPDTVTTPGHTNTPVQVRSLTPGTLFIIDNGDPHPHIYLLIKPSYRVDVGIYDKVPLTGQPRATRYEFLAVRLTATTSESFHITGDHYTEVLPLTQQNLLVILPEVKAPE